jgi:ketosteroid isomerase-like protein
MNSIEANKDTVTRFFDALNAGDTRAIVDAYADEGCVETKGTTLISGVFNKEQIAASAGAIFEVFPKGLSFEITGMVAEGEKVAVEATSRGEHISGQIYGNEYHFLFEFRDGKLLRLKEYMDTEQVTDVLCAGQRPPFGG